MKQRKVRVIGYFATWINWIDRNSETLACQEALETSPKGFSAFKCDVGKWIFSKSWEFLGNSLEIVTDCLHFKKSTGFLHFQSQLIVYILKVR
jgi:hypothetical protein